MGETEKAVDELNKLIAEKPEDLIAYMTLGALHSRKENYGEAAKVYDLAVGAVGEAKAFHWNLFFRRGISRERLKQWELAEPNFQKALKLYPDQPDVLNYLGYSWIDKGMHLDEGLEMIRKAVKLRPRSGYIIDSLGWAHYKLGEFKKAVRELERAVKLMPQDATVNDHLGDAYWKVGRKLEATFQWKHALTAKPVEEEKVKILKKLETGLVEDAGATAQKSE